VPQAAVVAGALLLLLLLLRVMPMVPELLLLLSLVQPQPVLKLLLRRRRLLLPMPQRLVLHVSRRQLHGRGVDLGRQQLLRRRRPRAALDARGCAEEGATLASARLQRARRGPHAKE
jgi:hypothetical protein